MEKVVDMHIVTAEGIGAHCREFLDIIDDGKDLNQADIRDELFTLLSTIGFAFNPLNCDIYSKLPDDPIPGVKYDTKENTITIRWLDRKRKSK